MKQKDIYWANLDPIEGQEQGGIRPCVIISGHSMNKKSNLLIICPISSQIKNYPGCTFIKRDKLNNFKYDSEIITFHVRTISKKRISKKIGKITNEQLDQVFQGLVDTLRY